MVNGGSLIITGGTASASECGDSQVACYGMPGDLTVNSGSATASGCTGALFRIPAIATDAAFFE